MHYYQHNIGDYRRKTGHLSLLEHGIYRSLLDTYYLTMQPLCADHAKLMRSHCVRTEEEKQALLDVLDDFFVKQEDGYYHAHCEEVIQKYKDRSAKAKASAEARWAKKPQKMPNECESNANASKINANALKNDANGMLTINQEPRTNNQLKKVPKKVETQPLDFSMIQGMDKTQFERMVKIRKANKAAEISQSIVKTLSKKINQITSELGCSIDDILDTWEERGWKSIQLDWMPESKAPKKSVDDIMRISEQSDFMNQPVDFY